MKRFLILILVFFTGLIISCSSDKEGASLTGYVDPFIGTDGHGHTYPGACMPFGMVQLSPDTRLEGWDGCSAYHNSDSIVYGFSHTHLSGTGCSDYGDILLMPTTGEVSVNNKEYCSRFSKDSECANPGYYSVMLDDYNIKAELTVTERAGFHKYTFPENLSSNIIIDLDHRDQVIASSISINGNNEITGMRRSNAWAKDQHVYFAAQFSTPFESFVIAVNDTVKEKIREAEGKNIKAFVNFITEDSEEIYVKVGISAVSTEGARKNLEAEMPGWDFNVVRDKAKNEWEKALGKIKVSGGTQQQKTVFYTALYHSMLAPNIYMDADGKYRGRDLEVHEAEDFDNYTVFSLWDTYRATHPLFTIIEQERTVDFIKTFIAQYKQGGLLPVWELSANETFCMIGYHSVPVVADAYMKGINDYDVEKIYEAMVNSADQDHLGLDCYKKNGFILSSEEGESVSKTLEYAYDDWCIAQMAKAIGKDDDYSRFIRRAQSYKNIFDPSTGFMRAKQNNCWDTPFDPKEVDFNFTEANSWQYSFYVPQDINGFIKLMGGEDRFIKQLDELFSTESETTGRVQSDISGLIGQYAHGNEPSHHMAYLYNFAGQPWKTQKYVRQTMDELYTAERDGLCGNEDCGQMSAWYVLSAVGFYPVTPGSDIYVIGTPLFPEAVISLENGNKFIIKANNVSEENIYIKSATLNGSPWNKSYIAHKDIMNGGELIFEMGESPNKVWGTGTGDMPVSEIEEYRIMPVPYFTGGRTFLDSSEITIGTILDNAKIYYTTDGTEPDTGSDIYSGPFSITETTVVKAFALKEGLGSSNIITARFSKIPVGHKITLNTEYGSQYSAGGDMALIDFLRGGNDFKKGDWQGYEGVDLDAVVDLGKEQQVNTISTGFIQNTESWIFMPLKVEYFVSDDGKDFSKVATVMNDVDQKQGGAILKDFAADVNTRTRFIKVVAENMGECPEWHVGYEYDGKAWIFADEIVIE